jgi:hypothetical protein
MSAYRTPAERDELPARVWVMFFRQPGKEYDADFGVCFESKSAADAHHQFCLEDDEDEDDEEWEYAIACYELKT